MNRFHLHQKREVILSPEEQDNVAFQLEEARKAYAIMETDRVKQAYAVANKIDQIIYEACEKALGYNGHSFMIESVVNEVVTLKITYLASYGGGADVDEELIEVAMAGNDRYKTIKFQLSQVFMPRLDRFILEKAAAFEFDKD